MVDGHLDIINLNLCHGSHNLQLIYLKEKRKYFFTSPCCKYESLQITASTNHSLQWEWILYPFKSNPKKSVFQKSLITHSKPHFWLIFKFIHFVCHLYVLGNRYLRSIFLALLWLIGFSDHCLTRQRVFKMQHTLTYKPYYRGRQKKKI